MLKFLFFYYQLHFTFPFFHFLYDTLPKIHLSNHSLYDEKFYFKNKICNNLSCQGIITYSDEIFKYHVLLESMLEAQILCSIILDLNNDKLKFDKYLVNLKRTKLIIHKVMHIFCESNKNCALQRQKERTASVLTCYHPNISCYYSN